MGNHAGRPGSSNGELFCSTQALDVNALNAILSTGRQISERKLRRAMFTCVEQNQLDALSALIQAGCPVSCHRPRDGFTPLHIAAANHLPRIATALVQSGGDITKTDLQGRTPVWMAARLGAVHLLEALLSSNPKSSVAVNRADKTGITPLMVASSHAHGDPVCVNYLLHHGARVQTQDKEGKSAAHYAAAAGDDRALGALLTACPEAATSRDNRANTPLHYGAERGEQAVCALLLNHDASKVINLTNSKSRTALWLAAERGDVKTVTALLRYHAQPEIKDKYGWNALRAAVYSCSYDTVEVILRSGCSVKSVCSSGISALHSAAFYDSKGNIAKLLVEYGADVQLKDKKNKMPVQVAAEASNEIVLKHLLSLGSLPVHVLKKSAQKCRDTDCTQLINDAISRYDGEEVRSSSSSVMSSKLKIKLYGSTGSTGDSSNSENCSEDASQRLRESYAPSITPSSSSTFTSRFTQAMSASFTSSMRKSTRKFRFKTPRAMGSTTTGHSAYTTSSVNGSARSTGLVPSKIKKDKMEKGRSTGTTFQCTSVSSRNMVIDLFDFAQLEFSEGSLRCSTIMYARQIKPESVRDLFYHDNVAYPSAAQLWSKPLNLDIPGSPGELLLPATLIIRCALPLPGTDLRIFRQKSQDAEWDEIEISSLDYIYDHQTVELSIQTAHLGTFVVGCCAGRSVQTVHKGQVHQIGVGELKFWAGDDFSGIGLEIASEHKQGDVICEIEPPIEFDHNDHQSFVNQSVYHNQPDSIQSHADCHPFIISLRLMDADSIDFKLHLPQGYCLGLKEPHLDSLFTKSQSNTFSLSSNRRLTVCVWKMQSMEKAIYTNRFQQFNIKAFFSLLRDGKNTFIHVSSSEGENSRELTCAEMEKIDVRVGGAYRLDGICSFTLNRGLLPLTIPLKVISTAGESLNHVVPQMEDEIDAEAGHVEIQGARRAVLLPIGSNDQMEIDEPMEF